MKTIPGITQILVGVLFFAAVVCFHGLSPGGTQESSRQGEERKDVVNSSRPTSEVRLEGLVNEALERNPSIKAFRNAAEAGRSKVTAERTLPDPVLSFETMGDPNPFQLQEGDPSSGRTYRIMQEVPFPGKLGLKGKIASSEAEVQWWGYEQRRRQVIAEVKQAYYDYYLIHKSIEVVEENKLLLKELAEVVDAKYRVGQAAQQDILKAQVEISKLTDRGLVLEQRRKVTEALLNDLLYRPRDTPLGRPTDLEKAELPYSLEELHQMALKNSPGMNMQEQEVERNRHNVKLAERQYYPDFAVSASVTDRKDMPEMYGLMLSVKVPLYFWRKQHPLLQSARLELASAQEQKESVASTLQYNVRDAYTMVKTSEELVRLYKTTVLPQASLSLESALASYRVGLVDFLTLLDTESTLLNYQLKYYESLADFRKALARLEPLVGVELTN